jgi:hypothetical protein
MHAADVMHATNYLISGKLAAQIPQEELLAVLLRWGIIQLCFFFVLLFSKKEDVSRPLKCMVV